MLLNRLLFSSLILISVAACSKDQNLEDPIRAIQNAQALKDANEAKNPRIADEPAAKFPGQKSSKAYEVSDFNVDAASGKIEFHAEVVYFEYDDSTLTKAGMKQLESLAGYMQSHPGLNLSIEGHCDHRGSVEYNLALGQRRSDSVRKYLGTLNVPYTRLDSVSFGKEKPAAEGDREEDLAKNRRVEFAFKSYPGKSLTEN